MVIIFIYTIIITSFSYFLLEKKWKIEDATIYILTPLVFGFDVSFYDDSILNINDKSILNEIGDILILHITFIFLLAFTHIFLSLSFNYIFKKFKIKLIDEYKSLSNYYLNNNTDKNKIIDGFYSEENSISNLSLKISLAIHMIFVFSFLSLIILIYIEPYIKPYIKPFINNE